MAQTRFKEPAGGAPAGQAPREATPWQLRWRRFRRNRMAVAGGVLLIIFYALVILAPVLSPYAYDKVDAPRQLLGPSAAHLLGTDDLGRDLFSRILWGGRISLSVGFVAAGVSVVIGTLIGAVAGFFGGWVDNLLMRLTEVVIAFPVFFLLITIVAVLPRSIFNIMLVIGFTSWPGLAKVVRAEILSVRERDFTLASRAMGATNSRIIFRHILPNVAASIIVSTTLRIGNAVLSETALSFLGFGAPPPFPSWGSILSGGKDFLRTAPWVSTAPGLLIFLTVLAFNFVGDGLRDALDPKMKL
jgi:peptide/nickel transport system permease protein